MFQPGPIRYAKAPPDKYLTCDGLSDQGKEVSRVAPVLVAFLNKETLDGSTATQACFRVTENSTWDALLVCLDSLLASVVPPLDARYVKVEKLAHASLDQPVQTGNDDKDNPHTKRKGGETDAGRVLEDGRRIHGENTKKRKRKREAGQPEESTVQPAYSDGGEAKLSAGKGGCEWCRLIVEEHARSRCHELDGLCWRFDSNMELVYEKAKTQRSSSKCPTPWIGEDGYQTVVDGLLPLCLETVDEYFSSVLGKPRMPPSLLEQRPITLRVHALRTQMGGWVSGLPAQVYLSTDSAIITRVVYTYPSSSFRRFLRRLSRVPYSAVSACSNSHAFPEASSSSLPPTNQNEVHQPDVKIPDDFPQPTHILQVATWLVHVECRRFGFEQAFNFKSATGDPLRGRPLRLYSPVITDLDVEPSLHPLTSSADLSACYSEAAASRPSRGSDAKELARKFSSSDPRLQDMIERSLPLVNRFLVALQDTQTPSMSSKEQELSRASLSLKRTKAPGPSVIPWEPHSGLPGSARRTSLVEDQVTEFKMNANQTRAVEGIVRKCVNAFINSKGGRLYFGIEDNRKAKGVNLSPKERDDLKSICLSCATAMRPMLADGVVSITFHSLPGTTAEMMSKSWWKPSTKKASGSSAVEVKKSTNRCIAEVTVAPVSDWPFHLSGPKSGMARCRTLASSDVMSEELLAHRMLRWLLHNLSHADEDPVAKKRKKKKK